MEWFDSLYKSIYRALIEKDRYMLIVDGFTNTIIMAACAAVLGIAIGVLIAVVKYFCEGKKGLLRIFDWLCNVYTTVIRGTPAVVQLLIMSSLLVMFRDGLPVAIIGFGINSGAYVSEIIRSGINSVDRGQDEAGRSLGLNRLDTMRLIILPQAIKNILPALGNEFIVLLKETSIAGYIAVHDLTKAGEIIKNNTFDGTALFLVAIVYLVLVCGLTAILKRFERRLRKSDSH